MLPTGMPVDRLRWGFRARSGLDLGAGLVIAVMVLLSACGGGEATGNVSGIIVEVVGRDIVEVETLSIRSEDGKTWTFTTEGPLRFSPSHLREHQLSGQRVLVGYIRKGDSLVAVEIRD